MTNFASRSSAIGSTTSCTANAEVRERRRGEEEKDGEEKEKAEGEERKRKRVSAQLEFRELRDELGARAAGANEGARPDGE